MSSELKETVALYIDSQKRLNEDHQALLAEWDEQSTQPFTQTPDEALQLARALDYRYALQTIMRAQEEGLKSTQINLPPHTFQAVRQALVRQGFRTRVTPLLPTCLWIYFRV